MKITFSLFCQYTHIQKYLFGVCRYTGAYEIPKLVKKHASFHDNQIVPRICLCKVVNARMISFSYNNEKQHKKQK